jgi:hypothetical protein
MSSFASKATKEVVWTIGVGWDKRHMVFSNRGRKQYHK